MLHFQQERYVDAAKQLAKAADLGMEEAQLYNFLGISYDRTGRLSQAVTSYQHALKLDETLAQAHLNLGYTYQRQHRKNVAGREYQRACELNHSYCKPTHSEGQDDR